MKENLVILPNSPYSDWIIERSEKVKPDSNDYICFNKSRSYIKSPLCEQHVYLGKGYYNLCSIGNNYQRVIIHYHNRVTADFLSKSKIASDKIIWVLWSGDLYNTAFYTKPIYQSLTAEFIGKLNASKSLYGWAKEFAKDIFYYPEYLQYKKSFKNIKYIASPFEKDVEEASNTFNRHYTLIPFAFLSVNEMFDKNIMETDMVLGNKVMVGHAGTPENNHLDMFEKLAHIPFSNQLYCPLSYGNERYIKTIQEKGNEMFKDRFEPLRDFLPKKEYYCKLSEVGFAIFNTNIQKGFGNILGLLFIGVKVFLKQENSVYFQLRKWGIIVREINEINEQELQTPLTKEEVDQNKEKILMLFNSQKLDEYYQNLYNFKPVTH